MTQQKQHQLCAAVAHSALMPCNAVQAVSNKINNLVKCCRKYCLNFNLYAYIMHSSDCYLLVIRNQYTL